MDMLLKD